MNKEELFFWGVQPLIINAKNMQSWDRLRMIKVALRVGKEIPRSVSAEDAVDRFFHYIVSSDNDASAEFKGW